MPDKIYNYGLQPTPEDPRDFALGDVFGYGDIAEVPNEDFMAAAPLEIKDQRGSDMCTGFSLTSVSEDQEGVILDPGFTFAMIKRLQGDWRSWGGDLRSGCKVATKIGFLEKSETPFDFLRNGRNFVANWNNWPAELIESAKKHKKESFFKITGDYDTFDNLRIALWQNKDENRSIYTGCLWKGAWNSAPEGVVPKTIHLGGIGHAFKLCGQRMISGVPYLVIQNSYGDDSGDKGYFYFLREVVNRDFNFGAYMFKDMPKEEAKSILKRKGLLIETPPPQPSVWDRLWRWFKNI